MSYYRHGLTKVEIVVILVVLVLLALILYPCLTQRHGSSWVDGESMDILSHIRSALSAYSRDHQGKLPTSLGALYPKYSRDKQIQASIVQIGPRKMAVIYWRPQRLGNPETPVVEIRPIPRRGVKDQRKDWVLWGDMRIESVKR